MSELLPGRRDLLAGAALLLLADLTRTGTAVASSAPVAVGTRVNYAQFGFSDGSYRWMITRCAHLMPRASRDLQLVYGNFAPAPHDPEHPGFNPFIVSAQVEYPEGRLTPATFAGQAEAVANPGEIITSDRIDLLIPEGARYFVKTRVKATQAPFKWPLTRFVSPPAGDWVLTGTDTSNVSEVAADRNRQLKSFGPYDIIGRPQAPAVSVVIVGDSVVCTENGPGDVLGDGGFAERGLAAHVAWLNLSIPGDSAGNFVKSAARRLQLVDHRFTHALCALGVGDVRGGNEERVRQNLQRLWDRMASLGLKVYQTTITPYTHSTDKWTTVEGQTAADPSFLPGGIYHRVNQWIRSAPPPLSGYFDPAALLETSLDSGIWIAPNHQPLTGDGPHPDPLGAEIAAQSIDTSKLHL